MPDIYSSDSFFCFNCTDDDALQSKIKVYGEANVCSICSQPSNHAISFDELADWIEVIWRQWYIVSPFNNYYLDYDEGDSPDYLIAELLMCSNTGVDDLNVANTIIDIINKTDQNIYSDEEFTIIDEGCSYLIRQIEEDQVNDHWNNLVNNLKHRSRFFNSNAIDFFGRLFKDIHDVEIYTDEFSIEDDCALESLISDISENTNSYLNKVSAICNYSPKSLDIFRARKVDKETDISEISKTPYKYLSNPPCEFSNEGRMNPKGISFFYGAKDRKTCISEIRPLISERVVTAQFKLTRSVRLLDFNLLSKIGEPARVSFFDDDCLDEMVNKKLLLQLHKLIATPVLEGEEFDYLPSQVMTEYLTNKVTPKIDGIIFGSVQNNGGENIVLFPHLLREGDGSISQGIENLNFEPAIEIIKGSIEEHKINAISHAFETRKVNTDIKMNS